MHSKKTNFIQGQFWSLVVFAFILIMAVFSLLPKGGKTLKAYTLDQGLDLRGKVTLPEKIMEGEVRRKDGPLYEGKLLDGHLHGPGKVTLEPGIVFEGVFDQGSIQSGKIRVKEEGIYLLQEDGSWVKQDTDKK